MPAYTMEKEDDEYEINIKYKAEDNPISSKSLDLIIKRLLDKYGDEEFRIRVSNGHRYFTVTEQNYESMLEDYYAGTVKDPSKFMNTFEAIHLKIFK